MAKEFEGKKLLILGGNPETSALVRVANDMGVKCIVASGRHTDDAKKYLAKKGYDKEFGARPLRRVVEQDLETPAAKLIVSKPDTKEVKFTIDDKHLYLNGEILEDVLFDKETREQEKKDIKEAEKADKKEEK